MRRTNNHRRIDFTQLTERVKADGGNLLPFNNISQEYNNLPSLLRNGDQRRNLLDRTNELDNGVWGKGNSGTGVIATVTANQAVAPDGTTTADLIVLNRGAGNTSADYSTINQFATFPLTTNVNFVSSIYVKGTSGEQVAYRGGGGSTATITFDGTWQRITSTGTVSSTTAGLELFNRGTFGSTNSVSFYAWGAQLELGTTASAYQQVVDALLVKSTNPTMTFLPVGFKGSKIYSAFPATKRNLLKFTEQFDNTAWSKLNSSITANSGVAPDGTTTADLFIESVATGFHNTFQTISTINGQTYTFSVYAKADVRTRFSLYPISSAAGGRFDLSLGTIVSSDPGITSSISSVGNGWYRCTVTVTTSSTSASAAVYMTSAGGTTSYAGDGTSGIYIWGAQFEKGSVATTYEPFVDYSDWTFSRGSLATMMGSNGQIRNAPHNLILQSETFDNAAWNNFWGFGSAATITANAVSAPNGTLTADLATYASGAESRRGQAWTTIASAGDYFTSSVYVKKGTSSTVLWSLDNHNTTADYTTKWGSTLPPYLTYNFDTDVLTNNSPSVATVSRQIIADGWVRLSISAKVLSTTSVSFYTGLVGLTSGSVYLWGATLNKGTTVSEYMATTTAAVYGPRFEYNAPQKYYNGVSIGDYDYNLITYSDDYAQSIWNKTNTSVTLDATVASPFSSNDKVYKVFDNTVSSQHILQYPYSVTSGQTYTMSAYIKAGTYTVVGMGASVAAAWGGSTNPFVNYTLTGNGSYSIESFALAGGTTASITSMGNGWYKCTWTQTTIGTSASSGFNIYPKSYASYLGTGTDYVYVAGVQVELKSTAGTYIKTTNTAATLSLLNGYDQNLLLRSEELDNNTAWSGSNVTVTANQITAPDGNNTADLLTSTGSSTFYQGVISNSTTVTYSVYVKKAATTTMPVLLRNTTTATNLLGVSLNLDDGTFTYSVGSSGASVQVLPNGWYRVSLTASTGITAGNSLLCYIGFTGSTNTNSIYAWGGMLNPNSIAGTYIKTTTATASALTSQYTTGKYKGLLIEKASTNLLTYSQELDNAAWTKTGSATVTVNVINAPDGTTTADLILEAAATSTQFGVQSASVTATASTVYTYSAFVKYYNKQYVLLRCNDVGSHSNSVSLVFDLLNGSIVSTTAYGLFTSATGTVSVSGNGWYKVSVSFNVGSVTSIYAKLQHLGSTTLQADGQPTSYTGVATNGVYAWGTQLEASAFPTSYIPTTSASVTRNSETCINTAISGWFNNTEGTLWASGYNSTETGGNQRLMQFDNGSSDADGIWLTQIAGAVGSTASGTFVALSNVALRTDNMKLSLGYKISDYAAYKDGTSLGTSTNASSLPTITTARIGHRGQDAVRHINGNIKAVAYFNTRRSNTELQTLTA